MQCILVMYLVMNPTDAPTISNGYVQTKDQCDTHFYLPCQVSFCVDFELNFLAEKSTSDSC